MAEDTQDNTPQNNSTSSVDSTAFVSGMIKDVDDTYIPEGSWSHAINATKVTANGSLNTLSNEPSNKFCISIPYTIIGCIHVVEDKWVIFSTDNTTSQIGLFDDSECSYYPMATDPCIIQPCVIPSTIPSPPATVSLVGNQTDLLNFNTKNLISGAAKSNFDCTWSVYFSDGLNPDRQVRFDIDTHTIVPEQFVRCAIDSNGSGTDGGCFTYVPTCKIDADQIRLSSLVKSPCVRVSKSLSPGSLLNGSYSAVVAYTLNEQKITDYFPISNVQPIFSHSNVAGSIEVSFSNMETTSFEEFELVIIRTVNQQTSAKKIGIYSTHTQNVTIDNINEELPSIPLEQIPIANPIAEKSDAIYTIGDYLVRSGPTNRFDFNYQPLANRIKVKWQSIEYPSNYYKNGGNNTGYLRDEIYSLFIRWVYHTGDRSSAYHIPGRYAVGNELSAGSTSDNIFTGERQFEVVNTASLDPAYVPGSITLPDGGVVIAQGPMGYWESTEKYPDNNPEVWNLSTWQNIPGWSYIYNNSQDYWNNAGQNVYAYDLCGFPIRHHKMPDNLTGTTAGGGQYPNPCDHINPGSTKIRILGVVFENIAEPLDNDGNPIPGIVGYEILRGSREGNKTVIAKGLVNNTRAYLDPNNNNTAILYQNYPYNYLGIDRSLNPTETAGGYIPLTLTGLPYINSLGDRFVTFHSPDTSFKNPFLAVNEIKKYGIMLADIRGNFEDVPNHPKEKLLSDVAFLVSAIIGIGEAFQAMRGRRTLKRQLMTAPSPSVDGYITQPVIAGASNYVPANYIAGLGIANVQYGLYASTLGIANTTFGQNGYGVANLFSFIAGVDGYDSLIEVADNLARTGPLTTQLPTYDVEVSTWYANPFSRFTGIMSMAFYWTTGTDTFVNLFYSILPYRKYAYRYRSHGFYATNEQDNIQSGSRRYPINDAQYLSNQRQSFSGFTVNNLYRSSSVILDTGTSNRLFGSPIPDNIQYYDVQSNTTNYSCRTITSTPGLNINNFTKEFGTKSSSFYAGLIQRIKNQYGQLDSIRQLPISCVYKAVLSTNPTQPTLSMNTSSVFGGDTYIGRYTEKNTFFYFYDWLQNQPDGYEFDYRTRYMITYPTYWADFTRFDVSTFVRSLTNIFFSTTPNINNPFPSQMARLDDFDSWNLPSIFSLGFFGSNNPLFRWVARGFFYLFQSGVKDFFVESEVNVDLRDWGELPEERFYDPDRYTSTYDLFDPQIIKAGNYYKYDYSLSISKLFQNFISWASIQPRNYSPYVAETCYVYRDTRLIYSLPDSFENKKDFWRVFLANNYKDFYSKVSAIKAFNANGAIILFENDSPTLWKGVDELQTNIGTKITVGDGGLFSQPAQSLVNVDISYEYGSSQDRLSVINTPFGLYYISASQGKIFHVSNRLDDITYAGLKFWFKEYLPYKMLEDFPTFDITANPVAGIGCQSIYDNQIETVYFCKKDYKLKYGYNIDPTSPDYLGDIKYKENGVFQITLPGGPPFDRDLALLGYDDYFDDASWTVSFDPKSEKGGWISFYDWHPDLNIPSRKNFLTVIHTPGANNQFGPSTIWKHNLRRDDFTNYYGTYYPFEIEYIASTRLSVNTLRSIEYYMECYRYINGSMDRFHLLDWNFDEAVVYNTEQVSGKLNLNQEDRTNPFTNLQFPRLTGQPSFDILYSKVEQKYRFDQFWDITNNRGQTGPSQQVIWNTSANGYTRTLNPGNLNYNKAQTERKKFRHYTNKTVLVKLPPAPGNINPVNMTVKVTLDKNLLSMR